MILSDGDIIQAIRREQLSVRPLHSDSMQPASIDLRLGPKFAMYREVRTFEAVRPETVVDPMEPPDMEVWDWSEHGGTPFILRPGAFVLGATEEFISLSSSLVGMVDGKSSLARLGLQIHAAGFCDPGFCGTVTLEMTNHSARSILLRPGMKIAHIHFTPTFTPAIKPYGHPDLNSKYQDQQDPTPSRFHLNAPDLEA